VADQIGVAPRDLLVERFPKWTLPHWCIIITAASFLLLIFLPDGRLNEFEVSSGSEAVLVARSLAANGTFSDPFATLKTGPTAHVAPVYPFLYSLVLRAFGTGHSALQVGWACNVFCFALQMGLLPLLSSRLQVGILPGIVAGLLGTLSLHSPIDTRWEPFLAGLLLLLAFLATERSLATRSRPATIAAGAFWGFSILTNPVLIVLLVGWPLCWICAHSPQERAKCIRRSVVIAGFALLIVAPWIARNYGRFGTFIFVRDNFGLELYTSNNPCAAPSIRENIESGCHAQTHPNPNAAVAAQLATAGEVSFNRAKRREAFAWIAAHPSAFLSLTMRRFRLFWLPDLDHVWQATLVWLITLLSLLGLWTMARERFAAAGLMATAWILFPLIYYAIQFEPRYRYPIFWTMLLPAGCALVRIWQMQLLFRRSPRSFPAS